MEEKQSSHLQTANTGAKRLANLLLFLVFTGGSLWVADLAFRVYEKAQLVPQYPQANGSEPVNLYSLRYNEGILDRQTAPGEFRILSFGDSFGFSIVDPEYSYNGVLQKTLQKSVKDYQIRVVNLGEPATGPRNYRAAYDFWSQVFEYQAVLFHIFLGNDVLDDAYIYSPVTWEPNVAVVKPKNAITAAGSRQVPRKFPLRMMDYAYAYWMSSRTQSENALPEGYNWAARVNFDEETYLKLNFKHMETSDPEKMEALLPGYEQVSLLLQRAQEISEKGIPVVVALGPGETRVNDVLREAVLKQAQRDESQFDMGLQSRIIERMRDKLAPDVKLINLVEPFRVRHLQTGERLFFRNNMHWDMAGNRLAGEQIAQRLLEYWFNYPAGEAIAGNDMSSAEHGSKQVSNAMIDQYLAQLSGGRDSPLPVVTGAVRGIQLFDGITGDTGNWAMAALGQPMVIEISPTRSHRVMRLYLYDDDDRTYRFTVDARLDGEWQVVADHSKVPVGGVQEINLPKGLLDAVRITGLYNSKQESNPDNSYIHIQELELID